MAFENIDTVFFDVGATLRYVVEDAEFSAEAERQLMELCPIFSKMSENDIPDLALNH